MKKKPTNKETNKNERTEEVIDCECSHWYISQYNTKTLILNTFMNWRENKYKMIEII